MSEDTTLHATPLPEKAQPAPVDMGPQKIGELNIEQSREVRARQAARAKVMGIILIGLCVLFFAITVVKIGVWG
jgi:hypothetical protein